LAGDATSFAATGVAWHSARVKRVYKQDGTSALEQVRQDRKILLPFSHDIQVAALPRKVRKLESRLTNDVSSPAKLALPPVSLERRMVAVVGEEG
jgi:hypothetical protein